MQGLNEVVNVHKINKTEQQINLFGTNLRKFMYLLILLLFYDTLGNISFPGTVRKASSGRRKPTTIHRLLSVRFT